jgi:hypothetical protein
MTRSALIVRRHDPAGLRHPALFLLAFLPAVLVHTTNAAAHTLPRYILGHGAGLAVYSNKQWVRSDAPGQHARQVTRYTGSHQGADPAYYIWAGPCSTGRQVLRFKRTVDLPGPPSPGLAGYHWPLKLILGTWSPNISLGEWTVEVLFNSHRVFRAKPVSSENYLPAEAVTWLRAGKNQVEVNWTKPRGWATCSGFKGVFFGLEGDFEADLYVGQVMDGPLYLHSDSVRHTITMKNLGTSTAYQAAFHLQLNPGYLIGEKDFEFELDGVTWSGGFISGCARGEPTVYPGGASGSYTIDCTLADMTPGSEGTVSFIMWFTPPWSPFDYASPSWFFQIATGDDVRDGPFDPVPGNNRNTPVIYFCDTPSSLTGCQ